MAGLDDLLVGRQAILVAAGSDQAAVGRQQLVDLAGHLHPRAGQHHQVVAHPLEVADQVRGQHHADLAVGHHLHQVGQELAAGQRVEAGHRLVEDQQLGALGDGDGEGQLGPLATRERSGPLTGVEVEVVDAALGQLVVPASG